MKQRELQVLSMLRKAPNMIMMESDRNNMGDNLQSMQRQAVTLTFLTCSMFLFFLIVLGCVSTIKTG